jgi:hypothetical protein
MQPQQGGVGLAVCLLTHYYSWLIELNLKIDHNATIIISNMVSLKEGSSQKKSATSSICASEKIDSYKE